MIETMKTGDRVLQQAEQLINDYNIAATAMIVYRRLNAENRLTKKQDSYLLELISKRHIRKSMISSL